MPWVKGQSGNPSGTRPETIEVKEVRRLAQSMTHEAFEVVSGLMRGAERDTVRLAAAIAVLKIAGLKFDAPPEEANAPPAVPVQQYSKAALMAAAKRDA